MMQIIYTMSYRYVLSSINHILFSQNTFPSQSIKQSIMYLVQFIGYNIIYATKNIYKKYICTNEFYTEDIY